MKFHVFFILILWISSQNSLALNLYQLAKTIEPIIEDNDLDYLQHLPRFLQSQSENTQLNVLTKFLIEDEEILKDNDGVYDESGHDGLDPSEELNPIDSDERIDQRARSAAFLWIKQNPKYKKYEPYGSSNNEENLEGWISMNILLMNDQGEHILKKVCLSKEERMISFVLDLQKNCKDVAKIAEQFNQKGAGFFTDTRRRFAGALTLNILKIVSKKKRFGYSFIKFSKRKK